MERLSGYHIVSLVGYQGSGKSTIGKLLSELLKAPHIETSAVVRQVTGVYKRESLASTGKQTHFDPDWLGCAVAEKIVEHKESAVILTGVRERAVHIYLASFCKKLDIVELTASPELRLERVQQLGKVQNAEQFIEQELRERELGLEEVIANAEYQVPTSKETDPVDIASAIAKVLDMEPA